MKFEKTAIVILAAVSVVFLVLSAASLYVFPIVDGYCWYGDETWLMLGWKNLLLHGRLVNPLAIGSTLTHSTNFFLGSEWISAILYGGPQLLTPTTIDIVHVGRTITFVLALSIAFLIAWLSVRLKLSVLAVLTSIALLVSAKVFVIQSHSARCDIIIGLTILGIVGRYAIIARHSTRHEAFTPAAQWFVFGSLITLLAFGVSPHLEVLLLPLTIYIVWYFGVFKSWRTVMLLVAGGAVALTVLMGLYACCNSSFRLFGVPGQSNQFQGVIDNFPILHPFSRSAQLHQLGARAVYLTEGAVAFWLALPLLFASELALWKLGSKNATRTFVFWSLVCVGFSSLFLQSTLPYYLVHILPLACFAFALQLDSWKYNKLFRSVAPSLCMATVVALLLTETPQLMNARAVGRILSQNNIAGVQAALENIGRTPPDSIEKPFLLAQAPAISELLRDTGYEVMNESFMMFPSTKAPIDTVLSTAGVDYILDYHLPMTEDYARMIGRLGPPMFSRTAHLVDRHVNYFTGYLGAIDTLSVYKFK